MYKDFSRDEADVCYTRINNDSKNFTDFLLTVDAVVDAHVLKSERTK